MLSLLLDPSAWAALLMLVTMEVVLGIDNLVFVSVLTNRLPEERRGAARRVGLGLALGMRLALLAALGWLVGLTEPVFVLPGSPALDAHGHRAYELEFSWRDLILLAGGLFLVWKATREIHHAIDPRAAHGGPSAAASFGAVIGQIVLLDLVFSLDSILTAIGMTDDLPIMVAAVITAVALMMVASGPLSRFIEANPTVVMLALSFLLMIGMVLVADGFGVHVPKGYVYGAMAFSGFVEALNLLARRRAARA